MLTTASRHFDQDMARACALRQHAHTIAADPLGSDVRRAAWMMAVAAADAYFCDAYADVISRSLRAKGLEPSVPIPDRLARLKVPVVAVIRPASGGWRWRMAARELIEEESVLSLEKVRQLFGHFFRDGHKIVNQDTIATWLTHPSARVRCFGITATEYRAMTLHQQAGARKGALEQFETRFEAIFQRRHDCIHNCDRPKVALQPISDGQASKAIEDVGFLVNRVNDELLSQFPVYLEGLGFSVATRNQVLQ